MHKTKIYLITGASDGLGKEIALLLAEQEANLILLSRNKTELEEVSKEAMKLGSKNVNTIKCDLRNRENIKKAFEYIFKEYKSIDGLINNAGIWQKTNKIEDINDEEIDSVIDTNLRGLILVTKYCLPLIKSSNNGCIINISSRSGYFAQAGQTVYSSTKFGVRGFTQVLREDLLDTSVRVAGVYQGGTNTEMFTKAGQEIPKDKLDSFIPKKELAKVIVFMLNRPNSIWIPEIRVESK